MPAVIACRSSARMKSTRATHGVQPRYVQKPITSRDSHKAFNGLANIRPCVAPQIPAVYESRSTTGRVQVRPRSGPAEIRAKLHHKSQIALLDQGLARDCVDEQRGLCTEPSIGELPRPWEGWSDGAYARDHGRWTHEADTSSSPNAVAVVRTSAIGATDHRGRI